MVVSRMLITSQPITFFIDDDKPVSWVWSFWNLFANVSNLDEYFANSYRKQRRRVAHKLAANTEDRFSHFTRWKATMEYAKTKDILHVMKLLGHKSIKNTLIYTQLVEGIKDDEYIYKIARTPNEISNLIEAGFEYVCEHD